MMQSTSLCLCIHTYICSDTCLYTHAQTQPFACFLWIWQSPLLYKPGMLVVANSKSAGPLHESSVAISLQRDLNMQTEKLNEKFILMQHF